MVACKCRQPKSLVTMGEIRDKELLPSYQWVQRWMKVHRLTWWCPFIRDRIIEPVIRNQMKIHLEKMDKWEEDVNQNYFHTYNCQFVSLQPKSYKEFITRELDDPFWRTSKGRQVPRANL